MSDVLDESNDENISNETVDEDDRFKLLQKAMQEFAMKIEIYDPLDREILNEDEDNQAINREELIEEIIEL